MQAKIICDELSLDKKFHTGWGVSFLIGDKVLFDTGEKGKWLIKNMENLKVEVDKLEAVVISHNHWDHTGGLWRILEENHHLKVYACPKFGKRFKNRVKSYNGQLIEVDKFTTIDNNIYTTGEIEGRYLFKYMPEQALVLRTQKGLAILTGCAHPGVVKIIENVKQNIPERIYLVMGGFHLMGKHKKTIKAIVDRFREIGIEKVGPAHCTGKTARELFRQEYKDNFVEIKVGKIIEI